MWRWCRKTGRLSEKGDWNSEDKKLVYGGVLIALGVLIPQAFHGFGENAGNDFLPMHIPVFIAGLLLGPVYGGTIGALVPYLVL